MRMIAIMKLGTAYKEYKGGQQASLAQVKLDLWAQRAELYAAWIDLSQFAKGLDWSRRDWLHICEFI